MSEQGKRKSVAKDKKDLKDRYAKAALSPSLYASAVVEQYGNALFGKDNMDMHCLGKAVREATEAINNGDMKAVEAMLYGQAVAIAEKKRINQVLRDARDFIKRAQSMLADG